MKGTARHFGRGFTLIELLVVIAVIAILAGIVVSTYNPGHPKPKRAYALNYAMRLGILIQEYESRCGHWPVSSAATNAAGARNEDFTFGGVFNTPTGRFDVSVPGLNYQTNNSEIIAILLDETKRLNTGLAITNAAGITYTQHLLSVQIGMAHDTNSPGFGPDLVWRDSWGNPFIVTLDLNNDQKVCDGFYRRQRVSQVLTGQPTGNYPVFKARDSNGNGDYFEGRSRVMVWSAGPDKLIDPEAPANTGANKDNIWWMDVRD